MPLLPACLDFSVTSSDLSIFSTDLLSMDASVGCDIFHHTSDPATDGDTEVLQVCRVGHMGATAQLPGHQRPLTFIW